METAHGHRPHAAKSENEAVQCVLHSHMNFPSRSQAIHVGTSQCESTNGLADDDKVDWTSRKSQSPTTASSVEASTSRENTDETRSLDNTNRMKASYDMLTGALLNTLQKGLGGGTVS